jgi:hypothetical protein
VQVIVRAELLLVHGTKLAVAMGFTGTKLEYTWYRKGWLFSRLPLGQA